jgi:hypothetical protein
MDFTMPLTELPSHTFSGAMYNPDLIHANTLNALLGEESEPAEKEESSLPQDLAELLDEGGTHEQAMAALEKAVLSGTFLDDDDFVVKTNSENPQAIWNDIKNDISNAPVLTRVDPKLVEQNVDSFRIFEITEEDDRMHLFINGALAADLPLGAISKTDFEKIIVFIQGVLDSISLAFALLGIGVAKGKTWATDLADNLKRPKSWLSTAKSAFGKFTSAYAKYKRYLADSPEETKKARKQDAATKAMDLFASAYLGFVGVILKTAWRIVKMVLTLIFGNIREVLRLLCQLTKAAIEWAGMGAAKLAFAIIDAILAAIAVWDDVAKWKELKS